MDGHSDRVTMPSQRLVDTVVHNLNHKMMESPGIGRTDIHARALPDRFEPFQHLYLFSPVRALDLGGGRGCLLLPYAGLGYACCFVYHSSPANFRHPASNGPVSPKKAMGLTVGRSS